MRKSRALAVAAPIGLCCAVVKSIINFPSKNGDLPKKKSQLKSFNSRSKELNWSFFRENKEISSGKLRRLTIPAEISFSSHFSPFLSAASYRLDRAQCSPHHDFCEFSQKIIFSFQKENLKSFQDGKICKLNDKL